MYQKVVVPLDQSPFSEFALPVALRLARQWGARLELLTIATPAMTPSFMSQGIEMGIASSGAGQYLPGESVEELAALAEKEAEDYLATVADRLKGVDERIGGDRVEISYVVKHGSPADAILRRIEQAGGDLVIMTTHARGPMTRVWLGSVADELVRKSTVPVLLLRPQKGQELDFAPADFRQILVPLEDWEGSQEVLKDVRHFAEEPGAKVTLLHVEAMPDGLTSPYIPHAAEEQREWTAREREAEARLEGLAVRLREEGLDVHLRVVASREVADAILDVAEASGADMIAMTTRGRRGIDRLVRGSVADEVTRSMSLAVLLRRAPTES